ncbi:MAG: RepB plasmid partition [Xanthobacteraceae bacterium]|jgi:hypothetical protein|nr:RepB plasmid partition [Xanthobacteraceae bacterium]
MTRQAFEPKTIRIPLERILPTRSLSKDVRSTSKFRKILASVKEVGIIEPLAVHRLPSEGNANCGYSLLDGHLRYEALKCLEASDAVCLVATDDEGYTYNRQINRLSPIQEHAMIVRALGKGVEPERIAKALDVDVERVRERERLLDGIAPEATELLKRSMVSRGVFSVLRKMKPLRQIEAAEMMISAERLTLPYAKMILAASRPEALVAGSKPIHPEASSVDIARMERQMEKLYQDYRSVEDCLGETMLVLVVAKGYVTRLTRNDAVRRYLQRHHGDLLSELAAMMSAVSRDARSRARE